MVRALVIDDSRVMRSILKQILVNAGFEVTEAGDGREGLDRLRELGRPDVTLVDWNMPVMDGLDFVRAVRANPRYGGLLVMMVTTETDAARIAAAREAGADEYVTKPFTSDVILGKLDRLGFPPHSPEKGTVHASAGG